jgi:hypothetical protein
VDEDDVPSPESDAPIEPPSALRQAVARHAGEPLGPRLAARGLGPYRGYGELLASIERLTDAGARPHRIGRSVEGEPILALHFGPEARSSLLRTTVILSGVHPNEWIGIEAHLALLTRLVGADLGDRAVVSIPLVNPDGIRRVDRNLREGRRRFVRHNARGVDLNRNFDESWGKLGLPQRILRGLFDPGPRPASEPEVEAIAHHLSSCRVERAVSLHSFGGAVLYPRASSLWPVHDRHEHERWATRIAQAIDPSRPYSAKSCARWAKGATAGGLELDWFHARHGAISLLVECTRGGFGLRPSRMFDPFAWFNPPDLHRHAHAIAVALEPFVKGLDA